MNAPIVPREELAADGSGTAAKLVPEAVTPTPSQLLAETTTDDELEGRRFYRRAMAHFLSGGCGDVL